jgi:hypothetical protein
MLGSLAAARGLLALFGLVALAGCGFSPKVSSGSLACGPSQSCPPGQLCSASGRCCLPDDTQGSCGPARPDAAEGRLAGGVDAGRPTEDASAGSADSQDAGGPDTAAPDPARTSRWPRLVPGNVRVMSLVFGCTFGPASAGNDSWCGFYRGNELWVLNVTRAAAAASARCDGTDSGCLRLSQAAFRADALGDTLARSMFVGDLLIYYAEARQAAGEPFRGGVYAWRPGWTQGRRLTSQNGSVCEANYLDASTVLCEDNQEGDQVDFLGGRLPIDGRPLPRIERVSSQASTARVAFSGDYLVYSWAAQADQAPDLYAVAAGQVQNPGARSLLSRGARLVAVAENGTRAYYLQAVDATTAGGVLMRVDVPSGRNPVEVARGVQLGTVPQTAGGRELGLATAENLDDSFDADVRLFLDPAMPMRSVPIGRAWLSFFASSDDGRFLFFLSPLPDGTLMQARVYDTMAQRSCLLGTTGRMVPVVLPFSADGRTVFWDRNEGTNDSREAWAAASADCAPIRQVSARVAASVPLDDGGVVFRDDTSNEDAAPLRVLAAGAGFATAVPRVIEEEANLQFMLSPAGPSTLVVYTTSAPGREGLYVAKVPF